MAEYIIHPTSELAWVDLFNEWQRVAVDHAPVPERQVAEITHTVMVQEYVAWALDAYPHLLVTSLNQTPPTLYFDDDDHDDVAEWHAEIDSMLDADSDRLS